jgi:signal transduction histidine kinase/ActR/RegA family two-component response regulator
MRVSLGTRLIVASSVLALVVVAAVLGLRSGTAALRDATTERARVRLDLDAVTRIERDVLDLETGVRGYVITRDDRFLEPWRTARFRLPRDIAFLRRRLSAHVDQGPLAESLATSAADYLRDYAQPVVAAAGAGRPDAGSRATTAAGKVRADRIRRIADRLRAGLDADVARLSKKAEDDARNASELGIVALVASSLLIALFTAYLLRYIVVPIRRVGSSADSLAAGDLTARAPESGASELAQLGCSFNRMAATIAGNHAAMQARNRELAAAQQEAERANRAKSEFLSRMSHELRTPLNSILGFGQLLQLDGIDERHQESVDQILRAGRHLLQMIDEVLDIARVETGELRMSPEPVEACELVEESIALVAPLAQQRSIQVVTDFRDCAAAHVLADRQRLKQILLNLFSNAIKYNREAGEIRCSLRSDDGERLAIDVSDTGAGMSREQLARIFEPFERLGAEHGNVEGTGLGLALSRRLAETMGGTLEVESEPGHGSTFSIRLATVPAPQSGELPGEHVAVEIPGERKILYIEDNLANLRLVELVLARHPQVSFLPAMQGRLGLELAREHQPDIVLLDLQLPDLQGHEVLIRLKAEPATRDTPVVVLSADASPGQMGRLRAAGAAAFLTKPLDVQELLDVVGRCLAGRAADGTSG